MVGTHSQRIVSLDVELPANDGVWLRLWTFFFFFFYSFILFHRVCNDLMDLDFFGKSVWQLC